MKKSSRNSQFGFLNSSILTNEMIQLRLNRRKVEEGKVELTVLEAKTMVNLNFFDKSMQISVISGDINSLFLHMILD